MVTTSAMTHSIGLPADAAAVASVRELERRRQRGLLRARLFGGSAEPVRLGRFQIVRKLGEGAAGVVYAAFDPRMQRTVALKVLMAADTDRRALIREARALAQLSHPNVLTVYEVNDEGDLAYIVSELVEGGSLRDWMGSPRSLSEQLTMLRGMGEGVASAHRAGLVHRDLKPENVLVGDGRPRIADFGLAKVWAAEGDTLGVGRVVGTPGYMAPEQRRGAAPNPKNDQFSFGVIAYELLYGRHPFVVPGASPAHAAAQVGAPSVALERSPRLDPDAQVPPPARTHPAAAAWPVVERALAGDPQARWPDVESAVAALVAALEAPSREASRRSGALTRVLLVAGAACAVGAGGWLAATRLAVEAPPPADTPSPGEADLYATQYPSLSPIFAAQDWAGCVAFFEQHPTTAAGRATWVNCAEATRDPAQLERACAATEADPRPPAACDAVAREARQLLAAGQGTECIKMLWETEFNDTRGAVMTACTQQTPNAFDDAYACLYSERTESPHGRLTVCGFGQGLIVNAAGVFIPVDLYAQQYAVSREPAACSKLLREHSHPNPESTCDAFVRGESPPGN